MHISRHPLIVALTALILLVSRHCIAENSDPTLSVYFHSSEINIHRNSTLKQKMDSFLVKNGNYQFQPVTNPADFGQLLKDSKSSIFMMPSWQYKELSQDTSLIPHLVGIKNSSPYFKKSFVIAKSALTHPKQELIIAASGANDYIKRLIKQMSPITSMQSKLLPFQYDHFDTENLLQVPKDLDALLSVGFGMAQAAIGTEDSLSQLNHLYKNQYDQLEIIATSKPLLRLLVVSHNTTSKQQLDLLKTIEGMDQTLPGKLSLSLIGLDSWINYSNIQSISSNNKNMPIQGSKAVKGGQQP